MCEKHVQIFIIISVRGADLSHNTGTSQKGIWYENFIDNNIY